MRIKFLGTAAAEGWPAVFCRCEYCNKAREKGGRNIRTRSQSLINDNLLIDFPVDTYYHMLLNNLDLSAVKYLLITHSHMDHFAPFDLHMRSTNYYAHNLTEETIYMYGSEAVLERYKKAQAVYGDEPKNIGVETNFLPLYNPTVLDNYTVTALKANHAPDQVAHVYLIEQNGKRILYLHDTGKVFDEVYDYLKKEKIRVDLVSFDCTYGALKTGGGHLGLNTCAEEKDRLLKEGVADNNTIMIVNHFSHNGIATYDEMVPLAKELGFETAYDGMEIEI